MSYKTKSLIKSLKICTLVLFSLLLSTTFANANSLNYVHVCTNDELSNAVANAIPDDVILLCDGDWNDLKLVVDRSGTSESPITIKAENPGKVVISGDSYIVLEGDYLTLKGFRWKDYRNPEPEGKAYILTATGSSNNEISEMLFEESTQLDFRTWSYNIALRGKDHEVYNTAFLGKHGVGAQLIVKEGGTQLNHKLHNLYFSRKPLPPLENGEPRNGGESLQIGSGDKKEKFLADDVFASHLFFENASGESEIISLKGSQITLSNIVMLGCQGMLSLRSGNNNKVKHVFVDGKNKIGSGAIRVLGDGHDIRDVFVTGLHGKWRGGLFFESGNIVNKEIAASNVSVEFVTIMNTEDAITIGTEEKKQEEERPPSNIRLNRIIAVKKNPEARVLFVTHVNNDAYTFNDSDSYLFGNMNVAPRPSGTFNINPMLIQANDGLFIPDPNGPAFEHGSMMTSFPVNKQDTGPQSYNWNEFN
jgi:poly(beta-D-mannuronate) lyase